MRSAGRRGSWPLGGIFLLGKGKAAEVSECSVPEALRLLLRCVVNFEKGPEAAAAVLANAAGLLAGAEFRRLRFARGGADFLRLI
jgi:hypothetical protein